MAQAVNATTDMPDTLAGPIAGKDGSGTSSKIFTLAVENMQCGNCMGSVEAALAKLPGVISARANLSAKRVTVVVANGTASAEDLAEALERSGFRACAFTDADVHTAKNAGRMLLGYLGVAGFAAANIMLLSIAVWAGVATDMDVAAKTLFHWLSAMIAVPAIVYAGQPFFRSALRALVARRLNMDVPISLGVILATAMSLYQTSRGTDQVYFDAAITLLFFLLIGRYLDTAMRARAAGAAANLLGLRSMTASLITKDGLIERVASHALVPGDTISVATGERIAVDGIVRSGTSEIDESLISGETRLKPTNTGAAVHAGTINIGQPLRIEAIATNDGTLLAEIGRLMAAAEQGRGRYVQLADKAARIYAPAVHLLGLATFLGWIALGQGWEASLTAAIAVLIITCPCALALAVPAVQVAASSRLFAHGIIVKAADGLERLAEIDTIVMDKTGTLTIGEPRLAATTNVTDKVLDGAASMALGSRHPYARALVKAAADRGLAVVAAAGVVETTGAGLSRSTPFGEQRLGSAAFCGGSQSDEREQAAIWYLAAGVAPVPFHLEDALRSDAARVVSVLKQHGYQVELLSGDRQETTRLAANEVGISVAYGEVKPDGKINRIGDLVRHGRKVLMVGDGLNDAPALAAAHASLSPSTAADISQSTADAVFQGEKLGPVVELLQVAKAARRMALQNFAIAISYNAVFVPLAVAGVVTPLIAAIAMSASSLIVTINAVRLRSMRLGLEPGT